MNMKQKYHRKVGHDTPITTILTFFVPSDPKIDPSDQECDVK